MIIAPLPLKIFDFVRFNGAINDFFGGSCVRALPKLAQDERKRVIPRWQLMNLHTDGYESVVDDGAVTKIGFIAFAGFLDFVGESLCVTMAGLQVGLCGWGWENLHGVSFQIGAIRMAQNRARRASKTPKRVPARAAYPKGFRARKRALRSLRRCSS